MQTMARRPANPAMPITLVAVAVLLSAGAASRAEAATLVRQLQTPQRDSASVEMRAVAQWISLLAEEAARQLGGRALGSTAAIVPARCDLAGDSPAIAPATPLGRAHRPTRPPLADQFIDLPPPDAMR